MSAKIMGKVWEIQLPANKLIVLLAMADHADHNGDNVFPGMALIAFKTGYSERQVKRIVAALVKDGILVEHGRSKLGTKTYSIRLEAGILKEPYTPNKQSDKMSPSQSDILTPVESDKLALPEPPSEVTSCPEQSDILSINGSDILSPNPKYLEPSLKPSVKESAAKTPRPRKPKPFDDIPFETRRAMITAWLNTLPEKPTTNEYEKTTNQNLAAGIARAGYSAADVERYVRAQYQDKFWQGKFLGLDNVAKNLPIWIKENPIAGVIKTPPNSAPPPNGRAPQPELTAEDKARIARVRAEGAAFLINAASTKRKASGQ